jgi:long-chain acyl-CoA synthetase
VHGAEQTQLIEVPSSDLLTAVLKANQGSPRPAVREGAVDRSWAATIDRAARVAGGLAHLGLDPGERLALLAPNCAAYVELLLAAPWAGAVLVPLNTRWSLDENLFALKDAEPRVLIVHEAFRAIAEPLATLGDTIRLVFIGDDPPPGYVSYHELLSAAPAARAPLDGDAIYGIFYTGGTTGLPKGVMLRHGGMLANARATLEAGPFAPGGVFLHVAPMFHLADLIGFVAVSLGGGAHCILPGFDAAAIVDAAERWQVTDLLLVPTMIQMLLDHPAFDPARLASLERIVYGASPISEPVLDRVMAALPQVDFYQAYGMTELSPVATVLGAEDHRSGRDKGRLRSAGVPVADVELRIAGPDGTALDQGMIGEVLVRSPGVMVGYWRRPEETMSALAGEWMHTGDGGFIDDDGYLHIVDRIKDMIVTGGENVYSAEVENVIAACAGVAQCAVIGVPDPRWGERVHAVVVPRSAGSVMEQDVLDACRARLAGYKVPKSIEIRETGLPVSAAGKILKRELRRVHWDASQRGVN